MDKAEIRCVLYGGCLAMVGAQTWASPNFANVLASLCFIFGIIVEIRED